MSNVALRWNANAPGEFITGYQVWGADGTGVAFGSCALLATVNALTWTDVGLPSDQDRTYYLVAVNSYGSSSPDGPLNITTPAATPGLAGAAFYCQNISTKPLSTVIGRFVAPYDWTLPAGIPDGQGDVDTGPTGANADFDILKNGVSVGTARWASGATVPSFIAASPASFTEGDVLEVKTPSNLHGMSGIWSLTIAGTR